MSAIRTFNVEAGIFDATTLNLLESVPEMRGDRDLGATNEGVTIVWLK